MSDQRIPDPWVDPATGRLTMEALQFMNDLVNNPATTIGNIGTTISGINQVNAKADAANANADAANSNAANAATGSGVFSASASPVSIGKIGTGSPLTTDSVTVTPANGTGPYTYAWTHVSDDTFTLSAASAATTTFSRNVAASAMYSGIYKCTVTDTNDSSTAEVQVSVFLADINLEFGF